jgi:hypothetical protein
MSQLSRAIAPEGWIKRGTAVACLPCRSAPESCSIVARTSTRRTRTQHQSHTDADLLLGISRRSLRKVSAFSRNAHGKNREYVLAWAHRARRRFRGIGIRRRLAHILAHTTVARGCGAPARRAQLATDTGDRRLSSRAQASPCGLPAIPAPASRAARGSSKISTPSFVPVPLVGGCAPARFPAIVARREAYRSFCALGRAPGTVACQPRGRGQTRVLEILKTRTE